MRRKTFSYSRRKKLVRRTVYGYLRGLVRYARDKGDFRSAQGKIFWQGLVERRNRHGEIDDRQASRLIAMMK